MNSSQSVSPPSSSGHLELSSLTKRFGDLVVLDGVDLSVGRGELLALLGPSGSGKTTALRLLAGFETADSGAIRLGGRDVTALPAAERGFGMVFQHYALFPHMTVAENVDFGLHGRSLSKPERRERIEAMLELVDLGGFGERRPGEISGGQQQRVALARALAPEPPLLLLDEPLSNLDPALRERTRRQLRQVVSEVGITTVLVTHEQEEAFEMGDRVAVLYGGELQQVGRPQELYERPSTRFVADFVGHSAGFQGRLGQPEGGSAEVHLDEGEAVTWFGSLVEAAAGGASLEAGSAVELVVRPERLTLVDPGAPQALSGRVVERRYGGPLTYYRVLLGAREVEVLGHPNAAQAGDVVGVTVGTEGPAPRIFSTSGNPEG
ncbi:MAG: ABC transporter ATP-binding protein [Acidobacteriota bacterium]